MMKNVQISQELFVALLHYHLSGENEYEEVIEQGLEQKLDAMLRHELYAQYKTAPTEEQREQARQEYLDRRGVPESFRWRVPLLAKYRSVSRSCECNHAGRWCWTGQRRGAAKPRPQTEAPGRAQRHLLMDGTSVKSAFALLSTKVTKPMPCPAPVTSTEKGRAIEKNHFRNAGSRLPQP